MRTFFGSDAGILPAPSYQSPSDQPSSNQSLKPLLASLAREEELNNYASANRLPTGWSYEEIEEHMKGGGSSE